MSEPTTWPENADRGDMGLVPSDGSALERLADEVKRAPPAPVQFLHTDEALRLLGNYQDCTAEHRECLQKLAEILSSNRHLKKAAV